MDYVLAIVSILFVMYAFDKTCLWLERKGWLSYSQTKRCNGKSVFSDLEDYIQPKRQTCKADGKLEEDRPIPTRYYLE
jgi:hypothetical protein